MEEEINISRMMAALLLTMVETNPLRLQATKTVPTMVVLVAAVMTVLQRA